MSDRQGLLPFAGKAAVGEASEGRGSGLVAVTEVLSDASAADAKSAHGKTGATGLEPATSGVTGRRSNQLSYAPVDREGRLANM